MVKRSREILERLYAKYNHREFIPPDPLQFVYRYSEPADIEIAAFLSAALAYGRVEQIEKSLRRLFDIIGPSPYAFVRGFERGKRKKLGGFKHRFTTGDDISDLLELLRKIFEEHGSIENYFVSGYNEADVNIISALLKFCDSLLDEHAREHSGQVGRGLKYLLASPAEGSACKRLNLFLRWMVREDEVDAGLWKSVDKTKLIVPVDVHIARLCRILGLYERKTVCLAAAQEITRSFAEIEPADPVKFDFALSRIGILEECNGKFQAACEACELFAICSP